MSKIAITGMMGSGKSTCSDYLRQLGHEVVDCDQLTHELMRRGSQAYDPIITAFSSSILNDQCEIDRVKLAALTFENDENRLKLESILHPLIQVEMMKQLNEIAGLAFAEVPLLFEVGLENLFDAVIVVIAPLSLRLQRLMKFRGISNADALRRMEKQKSEQEKIKLADYILVNDGTVEEIECQIDELLLKLIRGNHGA